jgi:hypothetical protein
MFEAPASPNNNKDSSNNINTNTNLELTHDTSYDFLPEMKPPRATSAMW